MKLEVSRIELGVSDVGMARVEMEGLGEHVAEIELVILVVSVEKALF